MNLIGFVSILILVITLFTIIFGTIAYVLYKVREKRRSAKVEISYEKILEEAGGEYVFFESS